MHPPATGRRSCPTAQRADNKPSAWRQKLTASHPRSIAGQPALDTARGHLTAAALCWARTAQQTGVNPRLFDRSAHAHLPGTSTAIGSHPLFTTSSLANGVHS
jgi:hypothetical protein